MSGRDPIEVTLQAAVQRGYLSPAQIQQAQAYARQPGAPGVLQLLHQRFLTPQQAADLGRVYQEALQGPGAAPLSDADAEQTFVTAVTPDMIAPPPSLTDSAMTAAPPPSAGFRRSGVLGPPPASGIADDSRTIQSAPPPTPTHAGASRAPGSHNPTGETVGALAALSQSRESGPRREGFLGPYRLIRELARGGMGVVYEAEREGLDRRVALKQLLAGGQATAAEVERFLVEARIAARLRHPHIVGIHDVGQEAGNPYFAMDFIEGEDLNSRLGREGPLPVREAAELTRKLADALAYAHARAVLHRDIKPANVLLHEGEPILTDFGLAKDVQQEGQSGLTQAGAVMGTPSYMPPEQAEGQNELVDRRADVYSLGATLYAMLTGEPPFKGATVLNTITKVLSQDPVPPRKHRPEVERDVEVICLKCLEKEPDARYPTAQALAEDLGRFLADQPIEARSPSALERGRKWVRRNKAVASVLALCSLLLLAGGVGAVVWQRQSAAAAKAGELRRVREAAEASLAKAVAVGSQAQGDALVLALDALIATSSWASSQRSDEAEQAKFEAALLLGRVATQQREWKIAAQSFARATELRPNSDHLARARDEFEELRGRASREREARRQRTRETLEAVRSGKLSTQEQLQDALIALLQSADEDTITLLLAELEDYARRGRELELEVLRRGLASSPRDVNESVDVEGMLSAYLALLKRGRRPRLREHFPQHWGALTLAKSGVERERDVQGQVDVVGGRGYSSLLSLERRRRLVGHAEAAGLAQNVLARIPTSAERHREIIASLRRCLACEVNGNDAVTTFKALALIPLPESLTVLYEHLVRFGSGALQLRVAQILAQNDRKIDIDTVDRDSVPAMMSLVRSLAHGKHADQIETLLGRILELQPNHVLALLYRGQLHCVRGDSATAGVCYGRARTIGIDGYEELIEAARLLYLVKKPEEGLAYFQRARAAARTPRERARAILSESEAYQNMGRYEDCAKLLKDGLAEAYDTELLLAYGKTQLMLGQIAEARRAFEQARKFDPENPDTVAPLAELRMSLGDLEGSLELLGSALERWPHREDLLSCRAAAYLFSGDPVSALRDCEQGLRVTSDSVQRALLLSRRAEALLYVGRGAEALESAKQALANHPLPAEGWATVARVQFVRTDFEAAKAAARRSLSHDAKYPKALLIMSRLSLQSGALDEARRYAKAVLSVRGKEPEALICLGSAELIAGNRAGAKDFLEQAVSVRPALPEPHLWLAKIAIEAGDPKAAEEHLAVTCASAPGDDEAWTQRGLAAAMAQRWEDATRYYTKALDLNARNVAAWSQFGDCARLANEFEVALERYRRALSLRPNFHHARLGRALCLLTAKGASDNVLDELIWFAKHYPKDNRIGLVHELIEDVKKDLAKQEK